MFRPYNLTSLAAWTVGSLAGNKAYYDTKIKQASLAGVKFKKAAMPACLKKFDRKHQKIMQELHELLPRTGTAVSGRDLARFCAYSDWFLSIKEDFLEELNMSFIEANNSGYYVANSEKEDLEKSILNVLRELQKVSTDIEKQWREAVAAKIPDYDSQTQSINEEKARFRINKATFKLVETDNSKFAQTKSRQNSIVPPPPPPTKSSIARKEFYLCRDNNTMGPYKYSDLQEWLKTGNVVGEDLVAYDGASSWMSINALIKKVELESRK